MDDVSNVLGDEIDDQAIIFHKPKSEFHTKVNEAAIAICRQKPHLVRKGQRGELSDLAREKVAQEGYCFKKGHSRSKAYGNSSQSTPKRPKFDQSMRKRLDELQEDIKMLTQRISLKEKRCMQAEAARNYKLCDELSEQMSELKAHKREKEKEHVIILRKEKRSLKYVAKVRSTAPALSVTSPPGANITSSVSSRSSLSPSRSSSVSAYFGGSSSESEGTCFSESDVMIVEPPTVCLGSPIAIRKPDSLDSDVFSTDTDEGLEHPLSMVAVTSVAP